MKRHLIAAFLLVAALTLLAAGCGGDDEEGGGGGGTQQAASDGGGGEQCAAAIGIMTPLTGEAAEQGQEQANFARLALDRFNQENGTSFELVEGDTKLNPAEAATVAQQFVSNEDMLGVVGAAGSGGVESAGPTFTRANLGFLSQSATGAELTTSGNYPTFFRVVPPDSVQGPTDARFMIDELGAQSVLIVDDQTTYSTGLAGAAADVLEQEDVQVARESVSQDQTDYSAVVSKIAADTDVVFLPWQIAANAQLFGTQMLEQGKEATIVGTDGLFSIDDFHIDGSYVSSFAPDITAVPAAKGVVEAFRERFGGEFGTFGPPAYAAATVVAGAIQRACEAGDASRKRVVEEIAATELPESILGQPIRFDENGDLMDAQFFIFTVKNEEFELVER